MSRSDDDKYDNEEEPPAGPAQLVGLVYDEFRRLARRQMSRESLDHTLQPTAVVHEAYMRLARNESIEWQGRTHFLAIAATEMRRVLVEHARAAKAQKRRRMGAIQLDLGRLAEAERTLRDTLVRMESKLGPWDGLTLGTSFNLALAYADQGREDEAFDRDGQRHWGYEGVREIASFRTLRDRPEFQRMLGNEGYLAALEAGLEAGWNKADRAIVIGWLRKAIELGCDPEMVERRLRGPGMEDLLESVVVAASDAP